MELIWGIGSPEEELRKRGVVMGRRLQLAAKLPCRDPNYGQPMELAIYTDRAGKPFVLEEISNGVWVIGVPAAP